MSLKKSQKIAITITAIMVVFLTFVGYLLIPRIGKAPDNYVWEGEQSFDINQIETLQKEVGKEFKILQLTDTQLDFPFKSRKLLKSQIDTLVKESQPNLIVLTGDNVAGVFTHFYVNDIIDIFDSYKIPWAPVFGNHDRELNANLYYQSQQYYKSEYCLFKEGPNNIEGVGNYIVNIEEAGKIVYSLYLFDSNGLREYVKDGKKVKLYDYIHQNQIDWYSDNVKAINKHAKASVPSMAFFHIPLIEFRTAYDLAIAGSDEAVLISGEKRENVCPPEENSGLFDVMTQLGSTTHIFAGHDHVNNFSVKYKNIIMTYGVKTGNFSYNDEDMRGGTIISISDNGNVGIVGRIL